MQLIISLRRDVPDTPTAQQITDLVKTRLQDHPEVQITAQVSERLEPPPN